VRGLTGWVLSPNTDEYTLICGKLLKPAASRQLLLAMLYSGTATAAISAAQIRYFLYFYASTDVLRLEPLCFRAVRACVRSPVRPECFQWATIS